MACSPSRIRLPSFGVLVVAAALGAVLQTCTRAFVNAVYMVARTCWDFVAPAVAREPSVLNVVPSAEPSGVVLVAAKAFQLRRAQREHDRLRQAWRACPAL